MKKLFAMGCLFSVFFVLPAQARYEFSYAFPFHGKNEVVYAEYFYDNISSENLISFASELNKDFGISPIISKGNRGSDETLTTYNGFTFKKNSAGKFIVEAKTSRGIEQRPLDEKYASVVNNFFRDIQQEASIYIYKSGYNQLSSDAEVVAHNLPPFNSLILNCEISVMSLDGSRETFCETVVHKLNPRTLDLYASLPPIENKQLYELPWPKEAFDLTPDQVNKKIEDARNSVDLLL